VSDQGLDLAPIDLQGARSSGRGINLIIVVAVVIIVLVVTLGRR